MPALKAAGFRCFRPRGAYYVMTDISTFGFKDDLSFAKYLVQEIGVACVPGSSFYRNPRAGAKQVRFAFCKRPETLDEAGRRLGEAGALIGLLHAKGERRCLQAAVSSLRSE